MNPRHSWLPSPRKDLAEMLRGRSPPLRIAVLWLEMSGYFNCCLRHLSETYPVEILLFHRRPIEDAPFDEADFSWISWRLPYEGHPEHRVVTKALEEFAPGLLLVCGWSEPAYRRALRDWRGRALRVMTVDNPWSGSLRQYAGIGLGRLLRNRLADFAFVPGERQARYVRKMGFRHSRILYGVLSADIAAFRRACEAAPFEQRRPCFLYVGRFAEEKGVRLLVEAYDTYRSMAEEPWDLLAFGRGPLQGLMSGRPGIMVGDFVDPKDLPARMTGAQCLVLPSVRETWGLVIHEAAAAGLPIICTTVCGASAHLVQDGWSGYLVDPGNVRELAAAMMRYSRLPLEVRKEMSEAGRMLAEQFTPERWARSLLDSLSRFER